MGVYFLVRTESGWQTITPRSSAKTNCSNEFKFSYYVNGRASENKTEIRAAQNKYTELCVIAYETFTPYEEIVEEHNIYYINRHYNEEIEVSDLLYNAFEKVASSRFIFNGPIQTYYDSVCVAEEDWRASQVDPSKNEEARTECLQILDYVRSEEHIKVELRDNNKIVLCVSEEYANFAVAHEIYNLVDFSYWKNAFIIDYMASELMSIGLTNGVISSYDGYTRTLSDQNCTFDIYSLIDSNVRGVGYAQIEGNFSAISLRSFIILPNNKSDYLHYKYDDGTYSHCYVDMADAMSKCSTDSLVVYSKTKKCTDMLQDVYTIWIADSFDKEALTALKANGAEYVYAEDSTVHYSDGSLVVLLAENTDNITYSAIKD